jgi:hypothetical protein
MLVLVSMLLSVALGPVAAAAEEPRFSRPSMLLEPSTHQLMLQLADNVHLGAARLLSWPKNRIAGSSNSSSSRKLRGINKIQVSCNPRYSKWCR